MPDTLWGEVIAVNEEGTIDLRVHRCASQNQVDYRQHERVYAADLFTLFPAQGDVSSRQRLQSLLLGKNVQLIVKGRNARQHLVGEIVLEDKESKAI